MQNGEARLLSRNSGGTDLDWQNDESVTGTVHLEWHLRKKLAIAQDAVRQSAWSAAFQGWLSEYNHLVAERDKLKLKQKGRAAITKAIEAHEAKIHKIRSQVNAKADKDDFAKLDTTSSRANNRALTAESWLDNRHCFFSSENLSATVDSLTDAALNCGYGLFTMPSFPPRPQGSYPRLWEDVELAETWWLRYEYFISHIDTGTLSPKQFLKVFEKSDKTGLSFVLGGMFCYLAAERWLALKPFGKLEGVFHYGLYCNALVESRRDFFAFKDPKSQGVAPDYIVLDESMNVHAFEAKGGAESLRHTAVKKGMLQLQAAPQAVALITKQTRVPEMRPVETGFTVHVSVDAGAKLRVLAYDPPACVDDEIAAFLEGLGADFSDGSPPPPRRRVGVEGPEPGWALILGLVKCQAAIQARQLFRGLAGKETERGKWLWKRLGDRWLGLSADRPYAELAERLCRYNLIWNGLPAGNVDMAVVRKEGFEDNDWKQRLLKLPALSEHQIGELAAKDLKRAVHSARDPADLLVTLALDIYSFDELNIIIHLWADLCVVGLARENPTLRFQHIGAGLLSCSSLPSADSSKGPEPLGGGGSRIGGGPANLS